MICLSCYIDGLKHAPIDVCGPPRYSTPIIDNVSDCEPHPGKLCSRICLICVYLYILLHSVQNCDLESLGRRDAFTRTPPRADSAVLVCEPIYVYVASFRIKNVINMGTRRNNNIYGVKLEKF